MAGIPPLDTATSIATLGNQCVELAKYLPKTNSQIGAECTDLIFKELSKDESIPYMDRLFIANNVKQIIKHSKNQRNIMEIANQYLSKKQNDIKTKINIDWFDLFLEECKTISNEQIQQIWGKVLSEECLNPNSIRKTFLFMLKTLDKDVAEAFQKLNNCSIQLIDGGNGEVINNELYILQNDCQSILSVEDILLLEENRLIALCDFNNYAHNFNSENVFIKYFDRKLKLTLPKDDTEKDYILCHGEVSYTRNGETLCNIIQRNKNDDFWIYLCNHLKDYKYEIIS